MPPSRYSVVAIDGPAASGKSSVSRRLAEELGFAYVNSGSLYRAVAWLTHERAVAPDDGPSIERLLTDTLFRFELLDQVACIVIDGVNPEPFLRSTVVNQLVSRVSSLRVVREFLLTPLRSYADRGDLIMEGRDIGTTVFPDTPYKFFIDASPEVRARRRLAEGQRDDLSYRDRLDSSRAASPLYAAPDSRVIDTSSLSLDEVVATVLRHLRDRGVTAKCGGSK
ncbi:MAG TPA: (d)CMP kinase [Chthoniobacterales bacterium]